MHASANAAVMACGRHIAAFDGELGVVIHNHYTGTVVGIARAIVGAPYSERASTRNGGILVDTDGRLAGRQLVVAHDLYNQPLNTRADYMPQRL